jgi:hypothetical protein
MPDDEVETRVLGTPVKVKGLGALVVVILALALGGLIWMLLARTEEEHQHQSSQQTQEHRGIVDALGKIGNANESIGEKIDEQNYIILLDDKERRAIKDKLQRPPSLSKRLREGN